MTNTITIPTEIDLAEFISRESHDLKSPFNRILGFLKLVIKGLDGPIPDQAKEDLTTVYQNSQAALVFMSSLVEMARLSRDERELNPVEQPLGFLVQQVVNEWKRQAPSEEPVEFNLSVPDTSIRADEILLRQGLYHWISYVFFHTQGNTAIDIQVKEKPESLTFSLTSRGTAFQEPAECDRTLHGYIANKVLEIHQGELLALEANKLGLQVEFCLPKA
jgi:K+-sensing histidine kinase KdpD